MAFTKQQLQAQMDQVQSKIFQLRDAAILDNDNCGRALGGWDLTNEQEVEAMLLFYKYDPPKADTNTPEGALVERNRAYLREMLNLVTELRRLQWTDEVMEEFR